MHRFERMMTDMAKMPPEEMAKAIDAEKSKCICGSCGTYTNCARKAGESFFCATGKSFMCIDLDKGCICPTCPVTADLGLKHKSYCQKGSEKAQRYENAIWGTRIT
jgi:hypothetical protein